MKQLFLRTGPDPNTLRIRIRTGETQKPTVRRIGVSLPLTVYGSTHSSSLFAPGYVARAAEMNDPIYPVFVGVILVAVLHIGPAKPSASTSPSFVHRQLLPQQTQRLTSRCPLHTANSMEEDQANVCFENAPYVSITVIFAWGLGGPVTVSRCAKRCR